MGGSPYALLYVKDHADIKSAVEYARSIGRPFWVLGGGSNTVFTNETVNYVVIKIELRGIAIIEQTEEWVLVRACAGELWDDFVQFSVEHGWVGVESMSGVPGTVGAAPIQNIGCYGAEASDTIASVEAYDTRENAYVHLAPNECGFGYRTSIFKTSARGRYIITAVSFLLSKSGRKTPTYKELVAALGAEPVTPAVIRGAVLKIRNQKLADYTKFPNVGSFFQTPVVTSVHKERLQIQYPHMPSYATSDGGHCKIPAGWLIEQLGYRGKVFGHFQFSPQHALILTHLGGGTMQELQELISLVIARVEAEFGVRLEVEPELVM
jgi:UDP-N-acetylmuramate dehydrogenase